MRTFAAAVVLLVLAGALGAQQRGSRSGFGNVVFPGTGRAPQNPNISGFGNVVFPGTGGLPGPTSFSITNPGFARGLQNTVSGRVPYGAGVPQDRRRGYVYVPYVLPAYTGGWDMYQQPYQQQPNVTVIYPQQQAPVVINQTFAGGAQPLVQDAGQQPAGDSGTLQVYQAPVRSQEEVNAAAAQTASYYLIAFKDHSIYSAVAYWIDGETLHYFTHGNTHNQVSMSLVDKELTAQLNKERKVDVRIPAK
jgi:hypothetical protein